MGHEWATDEAQGGRAERAKDATQGTNEGNPGAWGAMEKRKGRERERIKQGRPEGGNKQDTTGE